MAASRNPFRRIKLVYQRSSTMLKCIVLAALLLSSAALLVIGHAVAQTRAETEAQRQQAAALEQENKDLGEAIDDLGSVQSIKDIAGEELGLVDPDTVIIEPEQ